MANHLRRQIREAATTLLTGLATSGARVYPSRVHAMTDADLPGLRLFATEEAVETVSVHAPKLLERRLTLVVEACAKPTGDLDDTLDQMCMEVETVIGNNPTLSGTAKDAALASTEIDMQGEGERPMGVARLAFQVLYMTAANAPDTVV